LTRTDFLEIDSDYLSIFIILALSAMFERLIMCYTIVYFSRHGGVGWMVGLDDL